MIQFIIYYIRDQFQIIFAILIWISTLFCRRYNIFDKPGFILNFYIRWLCCMYNITCHAILVNERNTNWSIRIRNIINYNQFSRDKYFLLNRDIGISFLFFFVMILEFVIVLPKSSRNLFIKNRTLTKNFEEDKEDKIKFFASVWFLINEFWELLDNSYIMRLSYHIDETIYICICIL